MNQDSPRQVLKSTGQRERFSGRKLYRSLRASGASKSVAQRVLDAVEKATDELRSTADIEALASKILHDESPNLASRYLLKKALFDLGPTGYPFEKWVAALYQARGFRTEVGVVVPGRCISHEIDVVARRGERVEYMECKFRSGGGLRCDAKIALYVNARAIDLRERADGERFDTFRLVTNTKFSGDAIDYARCVGLDLLGWNEPRERGIAHRIEEHGLHPVTCLTALAPAVRSKIVENGVVLCQELVDQPEILDRVGATEPERARALEQARALLTD